MMPANRGHTFLLFGVVPLALSISVAAAAGFSTLESDQLRFTLRHDTGSYEILDKQTGVIWKSNPGAARFGEVTLTSAKKTRTIALGKCQAEWAGKSLSVRFTPLQESPDLMVTIRVVLSSDGRALQFSWKAASELGIKSLRIIDNALWVSDLDQGYAALPVRMGLLIPATSGRAFKRRFGTYEYEGCHMAMLGLVKSSSTALLTWESPYVSAEIRSVVENSGVENTKQVLFPSLDLGPGASTVQLRFCGPGDYVTLAQAYRQMARERGWWVPWTEKLKTNPARTQLFGAANIKLWSCLSRRMDESSAHEESAKVNWTFDEAAQVAEHIRRDLQIERALFTLGGWTRRGYDNQHPDILPTATECGGDAALADCAKRIRALGYLFCLHDNYQDIYRDSPSWNEQCLMKRPDGKPALGGRWAGGKAYLTCSQMALNLAKRPQNLAAVKALTGANAYFIDTTYAAGLQECFDPQHPLSRGDDMKWKQELSDYSRDTFGIFGSECGREWAIPHADFFEGLTGVSGGYYHDANLLQTVGGVSIPLFELVYRETIALYGKYGYDPGNAAGYVLHHIAIGRPLNYHSIPAHLYWKQSDAETAFAATPSVRFEATGPRVFILTYQWRVESAPAKNWRIFVHFTNASDEIKFQNDHDPSPPTSQWKQGEVTQGPLTVRVPDGVQGTFRVRLGAYDPATGNRARLSGTQDEQHRVTLGQLEVNGEGVQFSTAKVPADNAPDRSAFVQANGGWAEGMHATDRFLKNTCEILNPLHEITATLPMSAHRLLTPDGSAQQSTFGTGDDAVTSTANSSLTNIQITSRFGGEVLLPPYGFLVESRGFVAFRALKWNGVTYTSPALFTLRSLDEQALASSGKVRIFHGCGPARIRLGGRELDVPREEIVSGK